MELTVSRTELLDGLDRVMGAVEKRGTLPALSHVLFKVYLSRIELAATDLQIYVTTELPVALVTLGGELAIPAERFRAAIDHSAEVINIAVKDGLTLSISSEGRLFDLPCLDAADFPAPIEAQYASPLTVGHGVLPAIVKGLRHAVWRGEGKQHLCGIHLVAKGSTITAVATDGHRLSLAAREYGNGSKRSLAFTLPTRASTILSGCNSTVEISCPDSANLARFELPKSTLNVRLLEGEYPEYRKVVPSSLPYGITVNVTTLVDALESCGAVEDGSSKSICLETTEGELVMTALSAGGTAKVSIPYMGDDMEQVRVNSKYMLQSARALDGEEVFIKSGGPLQPLLLIPVDHGHWTERLEVIMPMRG